MTTNKDDFDTTYRKVKGFHIIGYDSDTDTFSKLHIDQDGHIYTKLLAASGTTQQELEIGPSGGLNVEVVNSTADGELSVRLSDDPLWGDSGPLQQHEKETPNSPARELLTYDTNLQAVLGTQRLLNNDGSRLKVESYNNPDLTVSRIVSRAGDETIINLDGHPSVAFQLAGVWTGTASFFGSVDGTTWYAWSCQASLAILSTAAITATANGIWQARTVGLKAFKVVFTTATTGKLTVIINASQSPISYQTATVITGSQAVGLVQRNATYELSVQDSALRESFYIPEPYNSNIIYCPGDVVTWDGMVYRCILQTVISGVVSSPKSTTYWTVDRRPSRSLVTTTYSNPPDTARLKIELDLDAYQYRLQEMQTLNQQIQVQNDMIYQDYDLSINQMGVGGQCGKQYAMGQSGQSAYNFTEIR